MSWVLVCHGDAIGGHLELEGQYLAAVDYDGNDGRGTFVWTTELDEAIHFDGFASAIDAWRRPSRLRPLRPDGRPNRPLTAFHVEPRLEEGTP
jgi:hypothetical protein